MCSGYIFLSKDMGSTCRIMKRQALVKGNRINLLYNQNAKRPDMSMPENKKENPYKEEKKWPIADFCYSDFFMENMYSSVIMVYPKPIIPCHACDEVKNGIVRFLNTASDFKPFSIYIGSEQIVRSLDNGEISEYGRVAAKTQIIYLRGPDDTVCAVKQIEVKEGIAITVAIINGCEGPDIVVIEDFHCNGDIKKGCFRVCNLSKINPKINVILNNGVIVFPAVDYLQMTDFQYVPVGFYIVCLTETDLGRDNILRTTSLYIRGDLFYTLYAFNCKAAPHTMRVLIIEDQKM